MLTLTILKSGWGPWLLSCESLAPKRPWTNCGRDKLWLVGCLGSEPRLAETQRYASIIWNLGEASAAAEGGACRDTSLHLYPGICLTTEENHENLSQVIRKALGWTGSDAIRLVDLVIAGNGLDSSASPCRPWLSPQMTWSNLGQLKYLPSCRTRGFPTSANLESKLAVRAPMWSTNSETPRSYCIYLLFTYQVAQVARRRHLDCNTCIFRTSERAADLHAWCA
jgi:hypothetical protein